MNAKTEILKHIEDRKVEYVLVTVDHHSRNGVKEETIHGTLEEVLPLLDFTYNDRYGFQCLKGFIWYADGTWSSRRDYEGAEWWEHQVRPELPSNANRNQLSNNMNTESKTKLDGKMYTKHEDADGVIRLTPVEPPNPKPLSTPGDVEVRPGFIRFASGAQDPKHYIGQSIDGCPVNFSVDHYFASSSFTGFNLFDLAEGKADLSELGYVKLQAVVDTLGIEDSDGDSILKSIMSPGSVRPFFDTIKETAKALKGLGITHNA